VARILLHVGCGKKNPDKIPKPFRGEDWREIRIDVNSAVEPDIVGSMTSMPDVASESVDAVLCAHSLEHLYAHQVPQALGEFWRVLRWQGQVLIVVPDLRQPAALIADGRLNHVMYESKAGPVTAYDVVFGFTRDIQAGTEFMAHRSGFVPTSLMDVMDAARFSGKKWMIVRTDIWAMAFKGRPSDQAPGLRDCP
jgi:protein O-GlcNAc transferase